ncbi:diguanylate cyclase [Baekduia soli]|uniref:Diguanylate cyclase n=1 Tax=Baekduia soli TaxID=496014 RepID=A0A5B8U3F9_9ACTN|nr:diguanylate cyclase [Baekduia soli]
MMVAVSTISSRAADPGPAARGRAWRAGAPGIGGRGRSTGTMAETIERSEHVLRARRTAARARGAVGIAGIALIAGWHSLSSGPVLAAAGFAIILATALVQLLAPRLRWLTIEESLAGLAGVFIIGLGDQRVTVLSVLWLSAVASGVLARGGRVHWIGRAVLLGALALPVVRLGRIEHQHAGLVVGVIWLLLTCGRLTTELNRLLALARHDADHDGLTGALSRAAFRRELASRVQDGPVGLLLVDLDNFGHINKVSGHAAGDRVLVAAVARLIEVAGAGRPVGRLGGDEFAMITGADGTQELAARALQALSLPDEHGNALRASVGIAAAPRDGDDADALLRAGDIALRVAKRSGKHQVAVYAGQSLTDAGPGGAQGALRRLIAGEGITMVVQPIVEPADGTIHAFEALARFRTRAPTARCTGSRWPTSSACAGSSSWPACGPPWSSFPGSRRAACSASTSRARSCSTSARSRSCSSSPPSTG